MKAILSTKEMAKAILDGTQTQYRKKINIHVDERGLRFIDGWENYHGDKAICPWKVGEVLCVREIFRYVEGGIEYFADSTTNANSTAPAKWKSAACMPKKYCRLFLEITSIGVEGNVWVINFKRI